MKGNKKHNKKNNFLKVDICKKKKKKMVKISKKIKGKLKLKNRRKT